MNYNDYNTQKLRGLKRKLELVKSRGGKCELCGYDRNIAVLEFHHINPDEKEFQLDMRHLSNTSLERLKEEADKCQLLCANCHREVHNPHLGMDEVEDLVNTEAKDKTSFENMTGAQYAAKDFLNLRVRYTVLRNAEMLINIILL